MAIKFAARSLVSVAACLTLGGCDLNLIYRGQPDHVFARTLSGISTLPASRPGSGIGKVEYDCVSPIAGATATSCYWPAKNVIDFQYENYKTNLLHAVNNGTVFADFTALALNTAGAITPGAAAAKLFNALSLGVNSTKTLVNQDILYKQTVTILISEMDSDRSTVAKTNEANLGKTPAPTAAEVVNGLLSYYEAGTFQHALITLANKAGTEAPASTTTTSTNAQVVVTIKPNSGQKYCTGSTFALSATIGTTKIDISTDKPVGKSVTPAAAATSFAGQAEWASTGATAKPGPSSGSFTVSYTSGSVVLWTPTNGPKNTCIMLAGNQTTPSAK